MSNKSVASDGDGWDRAKGRRSIYFDEDEICALQGLATSSGETEQDVVRRLVKEMARGLWVRKEVLDAYKDILDRLTLVRQQPDGIPTFSKAAQPRSEERTG